MIKLRIYDPRILAIDLRHRRFGFAVFEGHRRLLGWGIRVYKAVGEVEAAMASQRLAVLLKSYSPSSIVVTKERWDRGQIDSNMRLLDEAITREATAHSIPVCYIRQSDVRYSFLRLGCETRYEIASTLASIFPELIWKLPLKRQVWQSEHPRMIMFDAIAIGFAYWQHESTLIPPPTDSGPNTR